MQIVIDIPEYLYKAIQSYKNPTEEETAIANGIPLPKGHGRLIDTDEVYERLNEINGTAELDMAFDVIENAPTIIEADKESEDK